MPKLLWRANSANLCMPSGRSFRGPAQQELRDDQRGDDPEKGLGHRVIAPFALGDLASISF